MSDAYINMIEQYKILLSERTSLLKLDIRYLNEFQKFCTDDSLKESIVNSIIETYFDEYPNEILSIADFKNYVLLRRFSLIDHSLVIDWSAVKENIDKNTVEDIYELIMCDQFKERPTSFMNFLENVAKAATNNY